MALAEFGPATWTLENWIGVGLWVVAFLFLLILGWRLARPLAEGQGRGETDD
jgi:hypothetical protein